MTTAYAFKGQDGKWRLSLLHTKVKWPRQRPANVYDTQQALIEEAARRGLMIEWENAADS